MELDKVSKGESREERSGGNEAHIRSGSEGLCLFPQGNGNYRRMRINERKNQSQRVKKNKWDEKPCQEIPHDPDQVLADR